MTYQFDPRPEGLHYEPFNAPCAMRPMWLLRDAAPEPWIDLRSVFEAMGMSWRTWQMYCRSRTRLWALETCVDRKRCETLLAPASRLGAILGEVQQYLQARFAAAARVKALRASWRAIHDELRHAHVATHAPVKRAQRRRKVDAYVVRQVFTLTGKGVPNTGIARALRVSVRTVQYVAAGSYPLGPEALAAWTETFGRASSAGQAAQNTCKQADRAQQGAGTPLQPKNAATGRICLLPPTAPSSTAESITERVPA